MSAAVILGMDRLLLKLAALPVVVLKAAEEGREDGMTRVAELASSSAPRMTGALADSIAVGDGGESVSAGEPYAGFVEYGTSFMQAEPFLGPAFEQSEEAVMMAISNQVRLGTARLASL